MARAAGAALVVMILAPCAAPRAQDEAALTLEQAIARAQTANPALAAARLGLGVAQAGLDVARQRPNPEFSFEEDRETPHESYALTVPIETAGKRRRRVDLAGAAAAGAEADLSRLAAAVRVDVRRAYFAVAAAQRRLAELQEIAGFAQRGRDAAQQRFESGEAPRLDLLQAELNVDQSDNDLDAAAADLASARAGLNTLLARPPDSPLAAADDLDSGAVPEAPRAYELAGASSAELLALDRRLAEQQARVDLAGAQRAPDVAVMGALTHRADPEFDTGWRAGVSLELPVLNHHRAELVLEQRELSRLQAEREAAAARIRGEVGARLILASARRDQYLRYRDRILPRAAEIEAMASDSYRAGQTGLVAMLQALASARDVRLRAAQAGLDYQDALADLEQAIGAPLP